MSVSEPDVSTLLMLRSQAVTRGESKYFTGKPCKHGHISPRYTITAACVACAIAQAKKTKAVEAERFYAAKLLRDARA